MFMFEQFFRRNRRRKNDKYSPLLEQLARPAKSEVLDFPMKSISRNVFRKLYFPILNTLLLAHVMHRGFPSVVS
jgi:hypothetical protein